MSQTLYDRDGRLVFQGTSDGFTTALPVTVTYTNATLANGTALGAPFATPGYAQFGPIVFLRGVIDTTGLVGGETLFTLPVAMRPAATRRVGQNANGDSRVNVNADGTVVLISNGTSFCSLDGTCYALP